MSKSKKSLLLWSILAALLAGLLLHLRASRSRPQDYLPGGKTVPTLPNQQPDPMAARAATNNIRRLLREQSNLTDIAIERLLALARHETGNFTSAIFRESNNPWGMKVATVRPTTNIGEHRGHARYRNLSDAVRDMLLYLVNFRTNPGDFPNISSFAYELKNDRYFEDTLENYTRGLLRWYRGTPDNSQIIISLPRWNNRVIIR